MDCVRGNREGRHIHTKANCFVVTARSKRDWMWGFAGYPFVCGPAPPCEDDPTFQSLGSFSCGTTSPDICDIDAENAGPACGVR